MTREDIFKTVDHTLLAQTATWEEIKEICDDAIKFQTASVCIPASYVKRAKDYVDGKMAICTVIGFPNGYSTTAVKEYETKDAILNGADEIDMVINLGDVKDKHFDKIKGEIALLKSACGDKILKVFLITTVISYLSVNFGYPMFAIIDKIKYVNYTVMLGAVVQITGLIVLNYFHSLNALSLAFLVLIVEFFVLLSRILMYYNLKEI